MNIQGISPLVTAPLQAQTAQKPASTSQDPTSPVDPTQMVGQLVSLNQLDQLISINQTLSNLGGAGSTPTTSSSSTSSQGAPKNELGAISTGSQSQTGAQNELSPPSVGSHSNKTLASHVPSVSQALGLLQPGYAAAAGSNALMNLYGSFTAPTQTQQLSSPGGR